MHIHIYKYWVWMLQSDYFTCAVGEVMGKWSLYQVSSQSLFR